MNSCSSSARLRLSVPFLTYGPYRPFWTVISAPSAGSLPSDRGRLSRRRASSRVTASTFMFFSSDDVCGFFFDDESASPSCT